MDKPMSELVDDGLVVLVFLKPVGKCHFRWYKLG